MRWISVKERVQKEGEEVLTSSKEGRNRFYDLAFLQEDTWMQSFTPRRLPNITHWMPLPEHPIQRKPSGKEG